jgi:hypothetical protein
MSTPLLILVTEKPEPVEPPPIPAPTIPMLAYPVFHPRASAADLYDISVVMMRQGTHARIPAKTQTRTTSRPRICIPFWLLLLCSSTVHGITYNCINKTNPSSSCCSGEITLDPTMTSIANNAFDGCSGLTGSLIIPSSVTTIGYYAFQGCSGFTGSLTIPSSVTAIWNGAFQGCWVTYNPLLCYHDW